MISGEAILLEPYHGAVNLIRDKLKQARELTADTPRHQEHLNRLDKLVASRLDVAEQSITVARTQGIATARTLLQSEQGSREIEEIHRLLKDSIDDEVGEISEHSKRSTALAESTIMFVGGGSLLVLAFVLGAGGVYKLDLSRRQRTEEALRASETKQALIMRTLSVASYSALASGNFGALWLSDKSDVITDFHLFLQWLAAKGYECTASGARWGHGDRPVADLAVGCDGAGSHAWSYRDECSSECRSARRRTCSIKPAKRGDSRRSRRARCACKASRRLSTCCARIGLCGGMRIDHVLGLRRLWLVPRRQRDARRVPTLSVRAICCGDRARVGRGIARS